MFYDGDELKMGIQKDAGELLEYIYERYTKGENIIKPDDLIEETRWDAHRINNARTYLSDRDLIKIAKQSGNVEGVANYIITGLTQSGIDMIENEASRPMTLDDFIKTCERSTIEFKSSLRWDLRNDRINKDLEMVIVKVVAGFMNSESGTLLIGVMDDGQVFGIESDLKTLKKGNVDGFQQVIISLISDSLGTEFTKYAHIAFEEKDEKTVCKITVERAPQPVFFKGRDGAKEFYIRAGNTTRMLDSRETHEYIPMHWEA